MAIDTLITALETQLQLLEELSTLLSRETRELAGIKLDAMAATNIQKENLGARIENHATLLRKEIEAAAVGEGLSSTVTLGAVAEACGLKGEKDVPRLHLELNRVADRIRQTITINREVAERFAASVSSSLTLLTRVINQSSTYGASGGYQTRPTNAVLINREA